MTDMLNMALGRGESRQEGDVIRYVVRAVRADSGSSLFGEEISRYYTIL